MKRKESETSLQGNSDLSGGIQRQIREGSMPNVQADFETSLNQAKGGGSSLDKAFREKVEPEMGADFSDVKVHTDSEADKLSKAIQAKAFTTGKDIFFSKGTYEPGNRGGQELLAHELTHVVQQNGNAPNLQCWALPLDWLDYIGLAIDIGERIYIELAFEEGQEKEFKRFVNGLFFAIDAVLAILPGVGGGGIAARSSHQSAVAAYKSLPQSARLQVADQLAKTMGWSVNRTLQAINVYMSVGSNTVLMARPGNQADTGIMNEAQELISLGRAADICDALALLMQLAKQARDKAKIQRIKKTQKAKGCRHSRHS